MKTDAELRDYLRRSQGNLAMARQIACAEHHTLDQTLDMKFSQLEAMAKQEKKE